MGTHLGLIRDYVTDNPVVRREARLRFCRHWPTPLKLAVLGLGALALAAAAPWLGAAVSSVAFAALDLFFLAIVEWLLSWVTGTHGYGSSLRGPGGPGAGYSALALVTAIVLAGFAALAGARSISGEREAGTWEPVLITRLRPAHVVIGKIAGAMWPAIVAMMLILPATLTYILYAAMTQAGGGVQPGAPFAPAPHPHAILYAVLFAPAGYANVEVGGLPGVFWVLTAGALWLAQGATVGVFASLRYRSNATSLMVALLLLAICLFLNLVFLSAGGYVGGRDPVRAGLLEQGIVSIGAAWIFPLIALAIPLALAIYEFRDFDVWLQARLARAGS